MFDEIKEIKETIDNGKYGIPYKGSKNRLAKTLITIMKPGKRLVDMFGGGGAITHCASQSYKRQQIHYNELDKDIFGLFSNIGNLLKNIDEIKRRRISREEFVKIKEKRNKKPLDNLLLLCWSFGNNGKSYIYGKHIENYKKQAHQYCFENKHIHLIPDTKEKDPYKRKLFLGNFAKKEFEKMKQNKELMKKYKKYIQILEKKYTKETSLKFTTRLRTTGLKSSQVDKITNTVMGSHYLSSGSQPAIPTVEQWGKLKEHINIYIPQRVNELFSLDDTYKKKQIAKLGDVYSLQRLESLQSLQRLESLQSLQRLESLQRVENNKITYSNMSREQVKLKKGDVLYLDPPYEGTDGYKVGGIDYKSLRQFARDTPYPCYISSYEGPADFFCFNTNKGQLLSRGGSTKSDKHTEKIFYNRK